MSRRGRLLLGLGAIVGLGVVVTLGLVTFNVLSPERHADGAGPLASINGPGGSGMSVFWVPDVTSWTFGMPLCSASEGDQPVVDSVRPTLSVGIGYRFLGAGIRQFHPIYPGHTPIISVDGYPPPQNMVPDELHDIRGYAVTTRCTRDPTRPYTELLIGLGAVSDAGGGWRGVDVGYRAGGRHRTLAINITILICGTAVAADCSYPGHL
jgi:hypothetical protein